MAKKKHSMNGTQRSRLRKQLRLRDGNACHYCNETMTPVVTEGTCPPTMITIEHIVPVCYGGSNELFNLVLACLECNNARSNTIDYCMCERCMNIHVRWFDGKFKALMNFHRLHVVFRYGKWRVNGSQVGSLTFESWEDARDYAFNFNQIQEAQYGL